MIKRAVLVLVGAIMLTSGAGFAVSQQAESDGGMMALTAPEDSVVARRIVMTSIGYNNDALHDMLDGVTPWDAYEFQSRLESMAAMFVALPNLYRVEPDPWSEDGEAADPARVSLALPSVWEDWETFAAMANEAFLTTQRAANAPLDEMQGIVEELEVQCEACHETFRREIEFHDFDSLPPAVGSK